MKIKVILVITLIIKLNGFCQNVSQYNSEFKFRFLDEETGYKVIPEYVEIRQREGAKQSYKIYNKQISSNGTFSIKVESGVYDITVSSKGYKTMNTFFKLENRVLNVNFNLVPAIASRLLSSEYIKALHRNDCTVIVGFIVDDSTGSPIKNVAVYSEDNSQKAFSDENGFFKIIIPLPESEKIVEERGTLIFKKEGHKIEIRKNFDLWPNGDAIFRIRMNKGTGTHKGDILQNRKAIRMVLDRITKTLKES